MFCETPTQIKGAMAKVGKFKVNALDTETTGLDWKACQCLGLSTAGDSDKGYFMFLPAASKRKDITAVTANPKIDKVFHNAKFDLHFLKKSGIKVEGRVY